MRRTRSITARSSAIGAAVAVALAVAGCGGAAQSGGGTDCAGQTVRAGITNSTSDALLFIARDKGYFSGEGLTVEFAPFDSAAKMIAPLGSGQLDVGAGAPSAGFYNAVARGVTLRIVADKGSMPPGFGYMPLLVRKNLVDSGKVRTIADLRGMRVAEPAQATATSSTLAAILRAGGLGYNDVQHTYVGFPEHVTGLENGAVDASLTTEPSATIAEQRGVAVRFADPAQYYDRQQLAVLLYSGAFSKDRAATAQCFMNAYLHAARDFAAASKGGKLTGPGADEIVSIVSKAIKIDPELYRRSTPNYADPDGHVNVASLKTDYEFFRQQGVLEAETSVDALVDGSFAQKAVRKLGPAAATGGS
ncbi:ABC transporter substrate-binding protein [Pseudonocardia acidicola]|uniref:ABC transporter substrate-binding protein n=1 Tax=Pseudonocardia acidicola TaxID=2724939 RepID=A0ABX1S7A9_9PSEU|nr:ABC transporter substrate-binding protein [Pseudonocardia acidicola]NMH97448.1 ABC transporter substrate-binding protein [Pseudonocardia acidicola]